MAFHLFAGQPHSPHRKEPIAEPLVMKRNKLLHVKKFVIKGQMLGDFQTR